MWDTGLTVHWSIKQLVGPVLRGLEGVKASKVECWVGCKAIQIKCGQIPNGNDLLKVHFAVTCCHTVRVRLSLYSGTLILT